jgi:hypothetical protein
VKSFSRKTKDLVEAERLRSRDRCPLSLSVIPNYMGINLVAVDSVSWEQQDDGQLVSLTIHFIPDPKE